MALRFGAALGLGLLLGLERERKRDAELLFGGVGTFALIALSGARGGFMERDLDRGWLILAAFVALSALVIVSYATTAVRGELGITTEVTALVAFIAGARREPSMSSAFVLAIVVAWTIMFVRVVVVVGLVNRVLAASLALPLGSMAAGGLLGSLFLWRRAKTAETGVVAAGANPFELTEAIKFGLLFGIVIVVAKTAEAYLGAAGLYLAGAVAGLTDVDAISLSMANLAASSPQSVHIAAYTIVIAVISNTLVKAGMAAFMGAPALRRTIIGGTLLLFAAAGAGSLLA